MKGADPEMLDTMDIFLERTKLKKQFHDRTLLRETSCRLSLDPGTYCIIPNTLKPNQDGEFLLRVYTYSKIDTTFVQEFRTISCKMLWFWSISLNNWHQTMKETLLYKTRISWKLKSLRHVNSCEFSAEPLFQELALIFNFQLKSWP